VGGGAALLLHSCSDLYGHKICRRVLQRRFQVRHEEACPTGPKDLLPDCCPPVAAAGQVGMSSVAPTLEYVYSHLEGAHTCSEHKQFRSCGLVSLYDARCWLGSAVRRSFMHHLYSEGQDES
jgi:hypothetical protein